MTYLFGKGFKIDDYKMPGYEENKRNYEITTEGILEGVDSVISAFRKNGVFDELRKSCISQS
ncbi:MAG: hypothetical protein LBP75_11540 [Planctomycetota bacterium]|nr:hypothetical protein [Planctomycetota bacterium]